MSEASEVCKEAWIAHNDDFAEILANLNRQKANDVKDENLKKSFNNSDENVGEDNIKEMITEKK